MAGFLSSIKKAVTGSGPCEIDITFKRDANPMIDIENPYSEPPSVATFPLYKNSEPIVGEVALHVTTKKLEHRGVTVEFYGVVTATAETEKKSIFCSVKAELIPESEPLEATGQTPRILPFNFTCPKIYESYRGLSDDVGVSYHLKVTVGRKMRDITKSAEIWVHQEPKLDPDSPEDEADKEKLLPVWAKQYEFPPNHVSMEVGVEDMLHIVFKYDKRRFHLKERVLGLVRFKKVTMPLNFGEISLVKREWIGKDGVNSFYEQEVLQKYEIMDGYPVRDDVNPRDEVVPIRMYLGSIRRLTPTYSDGHDLFRVKYYLNLVLVTVDGKRYFKQQEIILYRNPGQ